MLITRPRISTALYCILLLSPALSDAQGSTNGSGGAQFGVYAFNAGTWNAEIAKTFPLVMVQYQGWTDNVEKIANIKKLAAEGQRVIVDFEFLENKEQRRSTEPMPSFEATISEASHLLDQLAGVPLEGVSIDEENMQSRDRRERLADVYRVLKRAYPSRIFLQWVGIGRTITGVLRTDWRAIPADGWIIDPYLITGGDYETYVQVMKRVTGRIYSVVWLAPGWQVGGARRQVADPSWWDADQWRTFYNRLAVNQTYGVTSIFYMYALQAGEPTSLWAGSDCDRAFHRAIVEVTIPYLKAHSLPRTTPAQRPDWIPSYCAN